MKQQPALVVMLIRLWGLVLQLVVMLIRLWGLVLQRRVVRVLQDVWLECCDVQIHSLDRYEPMRDTARQQLQAVFTSFGFSMSFQTSHHSGWSLPFHTYSESEPSRLQLRAVVKLRLIGLMKNSLGPKLMA